MALKRIGQTAGNTIRYEIDYSDWLEDGVSLSAATVVPALGSPSDVVVGTVTMTPSHRVVFLLTVLSLNETFTLAVQVTDSRNEIKNDTLDFYTTKP